MKDYLLEQGLAATAEMLTKESGMVDRPAPSKLPFSPPALAPPTNSSKKRNLSEVKSPTITSSKSRKVDINISNRVNTTISVPKVTASYHLPSIFDKFSHSSPRKSICKTPIKEKSTLPDLRSPPKGELSGSMNTNGVTLSGIINSYLRHQHQQCQHPVSIVPKFSLFEKHKCPAPPTSSNSLCDVLLQRRLFGDNIIRNKSHSFIDIHRLDQSRILRHRIFSEYRQWRIFQESQYDHISCAAFSCDSRKVWIGGSSPHADGMERGGSLRLFDLSSSQELGQWDFDHSIDSIISPSLSDSQILMTTTGHGAIVDYMPVVSYRTNIWRTSSHSQLVTDYFLDPVPLVDWEDFCRPVFNSQNTQVCGIPTQQINFISNSHAILKDVETGTNLLTFTRSSPSQSSLITVPYKIPNASFGLGSSGDNIVLADGILWDCRTGGVINDFDRLSHYGHGVFHPNGNCLLIDNFVWDMRKYSLLQTIKILDGGFKTHFSTDCNGTALFGYNSRSLEHLVNEEYIMNPLNLSQNCFYTLDSTDYSLIHTFELDSDGTSFWGPIQSDPVGLGYLLTCEVRFDNIRRSMYDVMRESCCRVLEIGRRKPGIQDSDMDDAQTIDDEDWEDDFGDEEAEEDDDILVDEEEDEEDGGFDEDSDHDDDSEDFDEVLEEEGTGDSDEEEYGDSDDEEDGDSDNEEDGDSDDIDYLQTNTNLIN